MRVRLPAGLFTGVHITIFYPGNKRKKRIVHRPQPGMGFVTDKGVDMVLVKTADQIDKAFPNEEYGMVQTGPASFNFVWRKSRPTTFAEEILDKVEVAQL